MFAVKAAAEIGEAVGAAASAGNRAIGQRELGLAVKTIRFIHHGNHSIIDTPKLLDLLSAGIAC